MWRVTGLLQVGEGGEQFGWVEVSLEEEGGREELVASHDGQALGEESGVLQESWGQGVEDVVKWGGGGGGGGGG